MPKAKDLISMCFVWPYVANRWEGWSNPVLQPSRKLIYVLYIYYIYICIFHLGKKGKLHLQRCRLGWDILVFWESFVKIMKVKLGINLRQGLGLWKFSTKIPVFNHQRWFRMVQCTSIFLLGGACQDLDLKCSFIKQASTILKVYILNMWVHVEYCL